MLCVAFLENEAGLFLVRERFPKMLSQLEIEEDVLG
jgi:hypothetical protein